MRAAHILYLLSAFATFAYAQDDSDCDTDNDDNDDSTCTSSLTSSLGPRQSLLTLTTTDIGVATTTDVGNNVITTSYPKSIRTYTTQAPADTTLVPVLTPSVISSATVIETNTLTTSAAMTSSETDMEDGTPTTSGMDSSETDTEDGSAVSTALAAANYAPGAFAGVLVGLAALI